jgi:hypothetical protein
VAFCHLHPLVEVGLSPFFDNFYLKTNFVLDIKAFIYALICSPHFSFSGPSGMVYETFARLIYR